MATLPATLDLSSLGGGRPTAVAGTIETSPELRMRLRWQPGCNGGRGAMLADFYSAAGSPVLLGRRVVLHADLFDGHHVPVASVPVDRVFRVRRTELEREVVIDNRRVLVNLRGADPTPYDLGSGAVVIEIDERSVA